jgi:uncharacterized membrane protein YraQ (UPF0718 family)
LPLFGGIYKRGAGLGAATAFLYSGPAINIMAIVVTAKVLGVELGLARTVGAIVFAVVIGMIMHLLYRKEERERAQVSAHGFEDEEAEKPLGAVVAFFSLMIGILVLPTGRPSTAQPGCVFMSGNGKSLHRWRSCSPHC